MKKGIFSGKSYQAAVSNAEQALNLCKDDLDIKIIDEGNKGIFGIGFKEVVIQVSHRPDAFIKDFLKNLFLKMQIDCQVSDMVLNADSINVTLSAKCPKDVIGKNAEILDAIQYITNLVASKKEYDNEVKFRRINIDIDGYRARRENAVRDLALSAAVRVVKYGRSVTLPALNSYERHLVHEVLENHPDVNTKSIGDPPKRRVVVSRKDSAD